MQLWPDSLRSLWGCQDVGGPSAGCLTQLAELLGVSVQAEPVSVLQGKLRAGPFRCLECPALCDWGLGTSMKEGEQALRWGRKPAWREGKGPPSLSLWRPLLALGSGMSSGIDGQVLSSGMPGTGGQVLGFGMSSGTGGQVLGSGMFSGTGGQVPGCGMSSGTGCRSQVPADHSTWGVCVCVGGTGGTASACSLLLSLRPSCSGLQPGSPEDPPQRMAWLGGLCGENEKQQGGRWGRPEAEGGSNPGPCPANCVMPGEALFGCLDSAPWQPGVARSKGTGEVIAQPKAEGQSVPVWGTMAPQRRPCLNLREP